MRKVLLVAGLVVLAACGDPETEDARGYTKAPLEEPGLVVAGEAASAMDALGTPDRPRLPMERREPAEVEASAGEESAGDDEEAGSAVTLAAGVSQAQYDQGQELFAGTGGCVACHGQGGEGGMLGPNLADEEWLHVDDPAVDALAAVIRDGVAEPVEYPGPMPAMGGASLTEEQVEALAGYVASLSADG